jgi:carbamoyl-phosphate synthase large subunit
MTDPEMADATYIEPITGRRRRQDHREGAARRAAADHGRPDRAQLRAALHDTGVLEKYGVELIGARRGDRQGRGPREVRDAMDQDRPRMPRSRHRALAWRKRARALWREIGLPCDHPPGFTLGGTGGGIAYNREEFERSSQRGLDASPDHEVLIEESICSAGRNTRWRSCATQRQLHHHLLDREPRPDGRAHRRLDHRRAGADADRREYQIMRDASIAVLREIGVDTGGSNVQFASTPPTAA